MTIKPLRPSCGLRRIALPLWPLAALRSASAPARAARRGFHAIHRLAVAGGAARGVTRATFEALTRGLEPDMTLPDLVLPGRTSPPPTQAEFVQVPADYLRNPRSRGSPPTAARLPPNIATCWSRIEQRFGVPSSVVLAIWGRETDYGRHALRTTRCACWRRRPGSAAARISSATEFVTALKIVQDGHVGAATCARHGRARPGSRNFCRRSSTSTASISTATAASTSGIRCRMRWRRPRSSLSTRAGSAACAGPTRCARRKAPIARKACRR